MIFKGKKKVYNIDGGQLSLSVTGSATLGIRVGVYKVKPGDYSKEREATEIFLITNDSLKPALNLYLSCGFVLNEQNDDNRYDRGNTKMNLILGE